MFTKIMVPVDLAHVTSLQKALGVAAALAKQNGAAMTYVGVTAATPTSIAHNPDEYAVKLAEFGKLEAEKHGVPVDTKVVIGHDPTTDVDDALLKEARDSGADLVVMASHIPGIADYVWPSNGGKMAAHSEASVFVVRG